MRTKKVNRYWCDFCNKGSLSASAMTKHEKHCTLNPARECRMCKMVEPGRDTDFRQHTLSELISILPVPVLTKNQWGGMEFQDDFYTAVDVAIPLLRKAAGDCPACMMAALRQAHIPIPLATGFDFTKEVKELWTEINEAKSAEHY